MTDRHSDFTAKFNASRGEYAAKIGARIDEVVRAYRAYIGGAKGENGALETVAVLVHRLAGAAGVFGFPEISETAQVLDELVGHIGKGGRPPSQAERAEIETLLRSLQTKARAAAGGAGDAAIARPEAPAARPDGEDDEKLLVFLVEHDPALAEHLASQLGLFGYETRTFGGAPAGLARAIAEAAPDVVIADLTPGAGHPSDEELLAGIGDDGPAGAPIVVLSDHEDLTRRLQAVRAGAQGYFRKPVDIARLVETLDKLTDAQVIEPYRILIVDDDRIQAEFVSRLLADAGLKTRTVTNPLEVMEPLMGFHPDLILMDINMPQCSGIELATVIRQRPECVQIPIVFLTAERSLSNRLLTLKTGGDDFLPKSVRHDLLVSSVISRAERSRLLGSMISRDSMTGLANHSKTKEHLKIELARADRQGRPLAYAMIDLDHFKRVNDTYGHWAGDTVIKVLAQVLRQRLRRTDVVGRYGGEEFAVILPDTDARAAAKVLDQIRDGFSRINHRCKESEFNATFSCGIAACPPLSDPALIRAAADEALYKAKQEGRNRIVLAQSDNGASPHLVRQRALSG